MLAEFGSDGAPQSSGAHELRGVNTGQHDSVGDDRRRRGEPITTSVSTYVLHCDFDQVDKIADDNG